MRILLSVFSLFIVHFAFALVADGAVCNALDCQARDGGRVHDFVWENDKFGMRAYGPGDGHVWSGLDVFNKCVERNVCIEWMLDARRSTWNAKPNMHQNLGEGMDNYTLGAGRGVGGVAVFADGEWKTYPDWIDCRRIHVGDDYLEFELVYPKFSAAGKMTYHITMKRGENFFRNDVSFEAMPASFMAGPGLDLEPKRDHRGSLVEQPGRVSLFEDPKGENGAEGSSMSAIFVAPADIAAVQPMTDHLNCRVLAFKGRKNFTYYAGAGWSLAGELTSAEAWHKLVTNFQKGIK